MSKTRLIALFVVIAALGTAVDLASKTWIFAALGAQLDPENPHDFPKTAGESYTIIDGLLNLSCAVNHGAAFSFFSGNRVFLVVASLVAMGVVLYFLLTLPAGAWGRATVLAILAAGAVGNLYDRLIFGVVRDFIHVHWKDEWHYPIFNIADIFVVFAAGMILASELFGKKAGDPDKEPKDGSDAQARPERRSKSKSPRKEKA